MKASRVAALLGSLALFHPLHAGLLAGWETTGQTNWGTSPLAASQSDASLTIGGLTRGPGVTTDGTPVTNGWGGCGWTAETYEDGINAGAFLTFTLSPNSGSEVSVETLQLNYRRSGDGPVLASVQFQVGEDDFIDVEEFEMTTVDGSISPIDLSSIPGLQGHTGSPITFRIVPYLAPQAGGSFYIWGEVEGLDLTLEGSVSGSGAGDVTPPLMVGQTPTDNATGVVPPSSLTVVFNEPIARGIGTILVKETVGGATVGALNVTNPAQVGLTTANQIDLFLSAPLAGGTAYHVEIPAGALTDIAGVPNAFAGFSDPTVWNFTTAAVATPPVVVVSKFFNGSPDRIELLVTGTGTAGSTADLRGMIVKDFSTDMTADGGGKFIFSSHALWSEVPAGTLVTLSNWSRSPDLEAGDFTLSVGLTDPAFFSLAPGSPDLDLTATDMVMIKEAGSDPAGTAGGIHTLASGTATALSYFTSFTGAKLRSPATAGTNLGVRANNSTAALADFTSGTDATGSLPLTLGDFGAPNSGPNAAYLATLRGLAAGSGDGVAIVTNATLGSPLLGRPMFDPGQGTQSVRITLLAQAGSATLSQVRITVPAALGSPAGAVLSGPAASGASVTVDGPVILINTAQVTTANALEVTISGLSTPTPALVSDHGNHPLEISTAASGGPLMTIPSPPAVRVAVPISSLRDVDANGLAEDSGMVVVVDGTVTEADFGGGAANFSGFLQDATAGINVFSPSTNLTLTRGVRFTITGSVAQINGQTAILPTGGSGLISRGTVPEVAADIFTIPALLAGPELHEGRLITLQNLTLDSGTWSAGGTVVVRDSGGHLFEVRIQSGSTATAPPTFPGNLTGILGQSDSTAPFDSGYFLMPRDPADVAAPSDFEQWLTGVDGGATGDPDGDGRNNAFEYAFGLNPESGASANPYVTTLSRSTGKFRFTRRTASLTGLDYRVYTSANLTSWSEDTAATLSVTGTSGEVETVEVTLSLPIPLASTKLFVRVEAE